MKERLAEIYVCPGDHKPLALEAERVEGDQVAAGVLTTAAGVRYEIVEGLPDFTYPAQLSEVEAATRADYDVVANEFYDNAVDWQFASMREDEDEVRERMIDWLELEAGFRVLEIGAGTGRDSFRIARRLDGNGELFLQDLSPRMVVKSQATMHGKSAELGLDVPQHFFISNAQYLPFPDDHFDAVFHFGGLNHFSDPKASLEEMARVATTGAKIVCGDEATAPWLRDTEFADIVITNNPLFGHEAPIAALPVGAREVCVRWILSNCFYVFDFRVGEGPPELDLDLPHKGTRGGTMRTRYYGRLEGVTEEAKSMAIEAAKKRGVSVHEWLDEIVRARAEEDLDG